MTNRAADSSSSGGVKKPGLWARLFRRRPAPESTLEDDGLSVADLLHLTAESLVKCGFQRDDFKARALARTNSLSEITLVVQISTRNPLVWDYASHLELYLIDRIHRRAGVTVARVLFVPSPVHDLAMSEVHNAVRIIWTSFRKLQENELTTSDLSLTDPGTRKPSFENTGYAVVEVEVADSQQTAQQRLEALMQAHEEALVANRRTLIDLQTQPMPLQVNS